MAREYIKEIGGYLPLNSQGKTMRYFDNVSEFPNIGNDQAIYVVRDGDNSDSYYWDNEQNHYYRLNRALSGKIILNGGNANG